MKRPLKILVIFVAVIVLCFSLIYAFISPIAKYLIEKNCIEWTGRKITLSSIKINAFKGSVYIKDIKIYEQDTNKIFFECHDVYLKVNLKKILAKIYEINEVKIDAPEISINQNGNKFNFDDLIKRFSSDTTQPKNTTETKYYITKVLINNGTVTYNNVPIHNIFKVHNINFNLPELNWDKPESNVHLDFVYGTGGFFNIDLDANRKTFDYSLALAIDTYDLSQYYAPLNSYLKISSFKGQLTTKLRMHGKFNNPKEFSLAGYLHLNDVEIKDTAQKKLFALGELRIDVDTINVKQGEYIFHKFLLDRPYVVLNDYPNGNNISRMLKYQEPKEVKDTAKDKSKSKVDYSNIVTLLASSAKAMAADFLNTHYHADSIAIRNGEFIFNDNTSEHKFHFKVSKINFNTDEVGTKNKNVVFSASALLNDTGKFNLNASIAYDIKKKAFGYKITALHIGHISPIVKYVLEKNSVKWIGRQVTIGHIHVDAMNGSVKVKDIKIYEANGSDVFFDCHDIYVKANLDKIFAGVYGIDTILIDNPEIRISQNGNQFNFDDLKKRFSSPPADTSQVVKTDSTKHPIPYSIDNVIINNGNVTYTNIPIHNVASIHNINFNLPEITWNNPNTKAHLDFKYGTGGSFNIDMSANLKTLNYAVALVIDDYDLSQYYAPLNSFLRISSLKGRLSTNLMVYGKLNSPKDISSTGYFHVDDFEMRDSAKQKVFAMGELLVDIDTLNVRQNIYSINNISMDRPYMRFDYFTNGNNISRMIKYTSPPTPVTDKTTGEIKPDYSNIFTLLSSSIKLMAVDFFSTSYHTDSVVIRHGQFVFNDYTLNNPFHYNITDISLLTDEISAKSQNIVFNASATLSDTGKLTMYANISIDLKNMLLKYNVNNLRIADFNPYSEYYVATPFWSGYMNYQSTDSVINRNLKSTNIIHIEGLEAGKKEKDVKPVYDLPVRMAVSLLKDEKGNIDLNIPATGNLDDPNYKMGKMVWPIISDVVKKTAESPFRLLAKLIDKNPEDLKQFNFDYLQEELEEKQIRKLENIEKVLRRKKELNVEIVQVIDSLEEKDELALTMAKKQYYQETQHIVNDSLLSRRKRKKENLASEKISTIDTLFDKYLNDKLKLAGTELITVEDKCIMLIGDALLNKEVARMMERRNKQIIDYLIGKKSVSADRVKVAVNKDSLMLNNFPEPVYNIKYNVEEKLPGK